MNQYQVLADDGKWYDVTSMQLAAYRADGLEESRIRVKPENPLDTMQENKEYTH